ncbi:hypothetical protein SSBR45G_28430 [Bradyrhizobium sp. SSBR45G]|uniref:hypothetical protein n=1 Tax=unclassified Bradyrhizobium TaxID=2631580 RepID=UPI002342A13A|nr:MULTISPECIES: hypothetical protein [unclassified Bradyrhizobium]GLH77935.1 hypothetical protein SSBR45G_28430 [Bradyrhizobium sp. SSBR45G]GLH85444.1 hypothetical protein SSBR45R_29040 [Bradyrhizobium sp. SSBR45R]
MTRTKIPDLETCEHARVLCSPVALAFVRIVMACRGVSEARARQIYLDYIDRVQPDLRPGSID